MALNSWIKHNAATLSAWSSFLQIVVFLPTTVAVVIGAILAPYQFAKFFEKPNLNLEFIDPANLRYRIVNNSKAIAEEPKLAFYLLDLDTKPTGYLFDVVQHKTPKYSYLQKNEVTPYYYLLGPKNKESATNGFKGHRYFGWASISCKNCSGIKKYWIYSVRGNPNVGWYISSQDPSLDYYAPLYLRNLPMEYLEEKFPKRLRKAIPK